MSGPVISLIICGIFLGTIAVVATIVIRWAIKLSKSVDSIDRKLK